MGFDNSKFKTLNDHYGHGRNNLHDERVDKYVNMDDEYERVLGEYMYLKNWSFFLSNFIRSGSMHLSSI